MPGDSLPWLVFSSGLLSSTLLPGNSEIVLSAAVLEQPEQAAWLTLAATLGNTIGGLISWGLGRLIAWRYPARQLIGKGRERALAWIERWGSPVLLLSWLPIIGDPLCVAAGWLRTHFLLSLLMIFSGKLARYALLVWLLPAA